MGSFAGTATPYLSSATATQNSSDLSAMYGAYGGPPMILKLDIGSENRFQR